MNIKKQGDLWAPDSRSLYSSSTEIKQQDGFSVVSGPVAVGKGTLCDMVITKAQGKVKRTVSYTTRAPLKGEKHGEHYYFVDREIFEDMISLNLFLEYALVHGNYYGTVTKQIEKAQKIGKDVLLEIDVQGAMKVKEKIPYATYIFIMPPSMDVLKDRLIRRKRGDTDIELRLANAKKEIAQAELYDYIVINDDLDTAFRELYGIIMTPDKTR
ncbi:MAG: guanylate kinase [Alphaproteobacteria bacterium]|nr:guanylate kinase [Alphaproteobacteria bacterium]MCL2757709.1 guanylate kinase [Alphaproteobacteria bacterium]